MNNSYLSLYELNNLVRGTLEQTFHQRFWMVAELSEVRPAMSGHCYVEFVEKDPRSNALRAKASGMIWRDVFPLLAAHFEQKTRQRLAAGLKVLVEVSVVFHELYGYRLVVSNIDPSYTLGDVARQRQEIIEQLRQDGVLELNKELPLPRPLTRVAVISSSTAAGYGDFCRQLEQSGYGFTTKLFAATMQGNKVCQSIVDALDLVAEEIDRWDVVVIIRGGGAVSDLGGFDNYELAFNVAQFPLPVLTGIGHERDDTVVDYVANTRLKTPTAVAAFLIDRHAGELQLLDALVQRMRRAADRQMKDYQARLSLLTHRLNVGRTQFVGKERMRLLRFQGRIGVAMQQRVLAAKVRQTKLRLAMDAALTSRLMRERHRLQMLQQSVRLASPQRILGQGYSITLKDGKAVKDAALLKKGDELITILASGRVKSVVAE